MFFRDASRLADSPKVQLDSSESTNHHRRPDHHRQLQSTTDSHTTTDHRKHSNNQRLAQTFTPPKTTTDTQTTKNLRSHNISNHHSPPQTLRAPPKTTIMISQATTTDLNTQLDHQKPPLAHHHRLSVLFSDSSSFDSQRVGSSYSVTSSMSPSVLSGQVLVSLPSMHCLPASQFSVCSHLHSDVCVFQTENRRPLVPRIQVNSRTS